jgi:hypothetical protein
MHSAGCTFRTQAWCRQIAASFVGCSQRSVKGIARLAVLGSQAAYCFCDSDVLCLLCPVVSAVWASAVDVGLSSARCWWSAGGIRLAGSLNLAHNSNFDVIGSAGVPVCGCRSQCYSRSVTKAAQGGWSEERWVSRRHLHRRDWRCVDRLAIARDSDRRTCCVAEANAGDQRSGEGGGGRIGERVRIVAEHGVVVAGSDCGIASVGDAGRRRCCCELGTRRRNSSSGSGGVGSGGEGGAEGVVVVQGWTAMQCNAMLRVWSVSRSIFGLAGGRSATLC